jgi:ferredoxin
MTHQLRVNPIACTGHGVCAELLPEIIELDPWGYPILRSATVPPALVPHAQRAAATCPTLALILEKAQHRALLVTAVAPHAGGTAPRADGRGRRRRRPCIAGHDHGHRELPVGERYLGVDGGPAEHVA